MLKEHFKRITVSLPVNRESEKGERESRRESMREGEREPNSRLVEFIYCVQKYTRKTSTYVS